MECDNLQNIQKYYYPGRVADVTNREELLTKKEHDLFCSNCLKEFINTMTRLETMFQRTVLTQWRVYSLDRLSVGLIP